MTLTVSQADIANASITAIPDQIYTGSAIIISPTVIGSGIDSMKLKPISNLKNAIRTKNTINKLGKEIIVTLDFNS